LDHSVEQATYVTVLSDKLKGLIPQSLQLQMQV